MRISTGMIFDAGVRTINRQTAQLLHLQQQIASNRRILSPSDDPVAAARALEVTQSRDVVAQFKANHNNATSALGLEEAQLTSTTDLLARIRELTVQAGNTGLSNSDRKAISFELRARFDELAGIANATDGNGQYLFSGYMGATKPFGGSVDALISGAISDIQYFGDDGQRKLQVSPTRFLEISDSGNDVFGRIRNGNGYFATDYDVNNKGTGVIDAGTVTNPTAWGAGQSVRVEFTVDNSVSPPVTYYDLIDDSNLSLLTGNPASNTYPASTADLRVYRSGDPIQLKRLASDTGAGPSFDYGASITITGEPTMAVVPPDAPVSVAKDAFTIKPSNSQSIFKTIADLIGSLEGKTTGQETGAAYLAKVANDVGFALTNIDQATDNILRVRAQIGSRMGEIESISGVNEDLDIQYQQTLSQLQDLDYVKAISDLTRKQTDLEAAQKSFLRSSQLSLFDFI